MIKPEISSFLKNQIIKEGENIEMKCRLGMILDEMSIQYKIEYGILDNGIKLNYGIQMRVTGIFTT